MKEGIKSEKQKMGFCLVQDAASQLNRIIVNELLKVKVKACSINPSSIIVAKNGKIDQFFTEPIFYLLNLGITPVLYGDIVFDKIKGSHIFSTEQILNQLAMELKKKNLTIDKIIHNGITKGVLNENNEVITNIKTTDSSKLKKYFYATKGYDITGGMIHKVEECMKLANSGIKSLIINGSSEKDILKNAILGKKVLGTIID